MVSFEDDRLTFWWNVLLNIKGDRGFHFPYILHILRLLIFSFSVSKEVVSLVESIVKPYKEVLVKRYDSEKGVQTQ